MEEKNRKRPWRSLIMLVKENKRTFILFTVLRVLVILTFIRCLFTGNYESAMTCVLVLLLFMVPAFLEKTFHIDIPGLFQVIIYLFIFAAEILGEVDHYYVRIPGWDTMLHTLNGFLCAAVGYSLIYILNRNSKNVNLSPLYVALAAFCFSMTIGVLWEFFECAMDRFFLKDMQKDFLVTQFGSVTLDPLNSGEVVVVRDIAKTVFTTADGTTYTIDGGYLDIGILDTMKDLFVNFLGAVAFCFLGFIFERRHPSMKITEQLRVTHREE